MRKCTLRRGSVAILVLAAGSAVSGETIYTRSEFVAPASTVKLALVHQELHRPPTALMVVNVGNAPGGAHDSSFDVPAGFNRYAVVGVSSSGGVFVSFDEAPFGVGQAFENLFPAYSEAALADALLTNGPLADTFINSLFEADANASDIGLKCRTTHFSTGSNFGDFDVSFTPIPEPAGLMILSTAGVGLLARRRGA